MAIVIDIVILAILGLSIGIAYKQGLVNVIFKMITFFLALIIAFALYLPVTNFVVSNTQIDDNIKGFIVDNFKGKEDEGQQVKSEDINTSQVVQKYIKSYTDDVKNNGIEKVAEELSVIVIKVVAFVGIFAVARMALYFVKLFANLIAKLPLIKEFNKAGGLIYGVVRGFIIVWAILAVIAIAIPINPNIQGLGDEIQKTYITKILYDYNVLLMILF